MKVSAKTSRRFNLNVEVVVVPAGESDVLTRPPFEGELAATTLWPETEKVFGHGYEVWHLRPVKKSRASPCNSL